MPKIDLQTWRLQTPFNTIRTPRDLIEGNEIPGIFEYTSDADGNPILLMRSPNYGTPTSDRNVHTRTEFRGTLNPDPEASLQDPTNNFVTSSAKTALQETSGNIDGTLSAKFDITAVPFTGKGNGEVAVGQFHTADHEITVIYKMDVNHDKGDLNLVVRPPVDGVEREVSIVGNGPKIEAEPELGVQLGETIDLTMDLTGFQLYVQVTQESGATNYVTYDLTGTGFRGGDGIFNPKFGAYNQGRVNTGSRKDYAEVQLRELQFDHGTYDPVTGLDPKQFSVSKDSVSFEPQNYTSDGVEGILTVPAANFSEDGQASLNIPDINILSGAMTDVKSGDGKTIVALDKAADDPGDNTVRARVSIGLPNGQDQFTLPNNAVDP